MFGNERAATGEILRIMRNATLKTTLPKQLLRMANPNTLPLRAGGNESRGIDTSHEPR